MGRAYLAYTLVVLGVVPAQIGCGDEVDAGTEQAIVRGVLDGDTIRVEMLSSFPCYYSQNKDGFVSVRLLGIDTPEKDSTSKNRDKIDPSKTSEIAKAWNKANTEHGNTLTADRMTTCGKKAKEYLTADLGLVGKQVDLTRDPGEPDTDRYDRPLRWILHQDQDLASGVASKGFAVMYDETACSLCARCREIAATVKSLSTGCLWGK